MKAFQPGDKVFWAEVSMEGDPVSVFVWEGVVVAIERSGYRVKPYCGATRWVEAAAVSDDLQAVRQFARQRLESIKARYIRAFNDCIRSVS